MIVRTLGLIGFIGVVAAGWLWLMKRNDLDALRAQIGSAPVAGEPECRSSPYAAIERSDNNGGTSWKVSGEQNVDAPGVEITVSTNAGSTTGNTSVTLFDPVGKRTVEASFKASLASMLSLHPLPSGLSDAPEDAWRRTLEHSAFAAVCSGPDPSLQRLLTPDAALRWWPGTPRMPDNYAVFVGTTSSQAAHWLEYLGMNHRRVAPEGLSEELQQIDQQGTLRLLRSAHGAVVVDTRRQAYAWIYVFPGGKKLRLPSVVAGAFEGNSVVLQIDSSSNDRAIQNNATQRIAVDLESGKVSGLDESPRETASSESADPAIRKFFRQLFRKFLSAL